MKVNDEKEAEVTVSPSNASNLKVEFEIGDPSVVNLDNLVRNGEKTKVTVIAVGRGQTIVTAKCGKRKAHLYVYVEYDDIKVTGLTVNPSTLSLKTAETRQLTTSVTPAGAASLPVSWISTNPDVVSVQDGLVTAEKPGSTNVWAYCGDQSAFCTVTVGAPEGGVDGEPTKARGAPGGRPLDGSNARVLLHELPSIRKRAPVGPAAVLLVSEAGLEPARPFS